MFGKNVIPSSGRSVWKCRAAAITAVGAISLGAGVGAQAAEPVMGMSPSAMKENSSTNSMEMHQSMMKGINVLRASMSTAVLYHNVVSIDLAFAGSQ